MNTIGPMASARSGDTHATTSFGRSLQKAKLIESTIFEGITPRERIQVAEMLLSSAIVKMYGKGWRGEIQYSKYRMAKRLDRFETVQKEKQAVPTMGLRMERGGA